MQNQTITYMETEKQIGLQATALAKLQYQNWVNQHSSKYLGV